MPFDFTLGAAVTPAPWFAVLADVSLQMGASYSTFPSSTSFNQDVTLRPTPRFNLGVEMRPAVAFPVRLGLYYNPSAEGRSPGAADYSKLDYYGVTAGVGLDTLLKEFKVRTTLGFFYAWANGEAAPIGTTGTTAAISSNAIGVLLTTGYAF